MPRRPTYDSIPDPADNPPTPLFSPSQTFRPRRHLPLLFLLFLTLTLLLPKSIRPNFLPSLPSNNFYTRASSPKPCICTNEHRPVCCHSADGWTTAQNSCKCKCRPNGIVTNFGPCPVTESPPPKPKPSPSKKPCICVNEYRPVCCHSSEGWTTAQNSCKCKCRPGGRVTSFGPCPVKESPSPKPKPPSPSKPCICVKTYRPVCCHSSEGWTTAQNSCKCKCRPGGMVTNFGPCPVKESPSPKPKPPSPSKKPCICVKTYRPVCCHSSEGWTTAQNSCKCKCRPGGRVTNFGPCPVTESPPPKPKPPSPSKPCICVKTYRPVCCHSSEGWTTAQNSCKCKCRPGGMVTNFGPCPVKESPSPKPKPPSPSKPCICVKTYRPVCCHSSEGWTTATNSCICKCRPSGMVTNFGPCP